MQKIQLTATCGFGLEAVVGRELMQLGYTEQTKTDGRVTFQADMDAIARCNIQLRTANRLLWNVAEFSAEDFDTFFDQIQAIAWEEIIEPGATIPVTGSSQKSTLHGVPTLQGMAKKAIVTRLTGKKGGTLEESGPEVPVHFDFRNNECVVSVNTSGAGLHRRGYRSEE
ncbi:MAG: class I SAM-dependent RNA methyltransferase, partial [Planctomycetaceae bacterium]|nr:class I SAM-dependent RNA methyltransferase [Planctomycetaceae bacterium]